jgi:hypothetical protein
MKRTSNQPKRQQSTLLKKGIFKQLKLTLFQGSFDLVAVKKYND